MKIMIINCRAQDQTRGKLATSLFKLNSWGQTPLANGVWLFVNDKSSDSKNYSFTRGKYLNISCCMIGQVIAKNFHLQKENT